ncbi:uncharacterized protein LOC143240060 isoform X3 [Tachypleus tridentatus]|uniref:uncharacterized protein LOC143240060 isoform X3 n=1 Tax=Tachypleus tridentatus TaxID=6853 RepID=UPI003FD1F4E3
MNETSSDKDKNSKGVVSNSACDTVDCEIENLVKELSESVLGACRKMRNISSLLLKFQVNQETQDSNIQKVEENSEFCVEHCLSKKNQYKSVLSTRDDGTFVTHGSNSSPRRTANGKFHRISTMELKDRLDFSNMQQTIVGKKLTELKEKLGQEKAKHNEELKQLRKEVHKLKAQKDEANRIVTHLESELSKLKESQLHSEQGYKELLNFVTYHIDLMVGMFALKSAETFEALSLCPQVQEPKYQLLEIKTMHPLHLWMFLPTSLF